MKIKLFSVLIFVIVLLTSCNAAKSDLTKNTEADTALTEIGQRTAKIQTDENETYVGFNTEPGIMLKSAITVTEEGRSGYENSQTDEYGYPYSLETYFDDWFERTRGYYDSAYSAFCLVKVTGVKSNDITEKRRERSSDLPEDISVIEQRVKFEIKRILASTDNIREKRLIKENDVIEGNSAFTVYVNKEGEMVNAIDFCFPVIEIGAEYIVFIEKYFANENADNTLCFLTVPLGSEVIDNDYLNVYRKNYSVTNMTYNTAVKYINRFLFDGISDLRVTEKLKDAE